MGGEMNEIEEQGRRRGSREDGMVPTFQTRVTSLPAHDNILAFCSSVN